MKPLALLASLSLLLGAAPVFAADEPAKARPVETTPAPEPPAGKVFLATELEDLKPFVGKKVTIEGKLERSGESKSKTVRYLNFTANFRDAVALVFFTEKGGESFTAEKLAAWLGKKVRVTGTLAEYKENLQIEIEKWDQVKEVPEAP